eukprot:scaffold60088_cov63-Phaeocystis_antarctica.AAC.1
MSDSCCSSPSAACITPALRRSDDPWWRNSSTAVGAPCPACREPHALGPPGRSSMAISSRAGCTTPASVACSMAVIFHGPQSGPSETVPRSSLKW